MHMAGPMAQGECRLVRRLDTHPSYDRGDLAFVLPLAQEGNSSSAEQFSAQQFLQPPAFSLLHLKDESQQPAASQRIWDSWPENFGR